MPEEYARTTPHLRLPESPPRSRGYISTRWRILTPLMAALMAVLMCGAYGVGLAFTQGEDEAAREDLSAAARNAAQDTLAVGRAQRAEVDRIAFTQGVASAVVAGDGPTLQDLLEPLAALAELDLVVVTSPDRAEIIGLQRVAVSDAVDYAVTTGTDVGNVVAVGRVLQGADTASVFVSVDRRPMLVTAGPVLADGEIIGVVLVGQDVNRVLRQIGGEDVRLALFGSDAQRLGATFDPGERPEIANARYVAALENPTESLYERLTLNGETYQTTYMPFIVGQAPLGVLAIYQPYAPSFGAQAGRQLLSLVFALAVAGVFIAGYTAVGRQLGRVARVRDTAERLTSGENIRTGMRSRDEIGQMGVALDRYAAAAQLQVRQLQHDLRQQRREIAHLQAILESLPDGVVVQDDAGRVITMNAVARAMLGPEGDSPTAQALRAWSGTLQRHAEQVLAPGLVALGQRTEIKLQERIVRVEAAALQSVADKTIGTVLTLQDVTQATALDAQRDSLIDAIANDVNVSLSQRAQAAALEAGTQPNAAYSDTMHRLAKEMAQDARAMQRMITEYRDLAMLRPDELDARQHPLPVTDLVADLLDAWRPTAEANLIALEAHLPDDEVHILGDEKRMLWALGNVLDNAIKYTERAGTVRVRVEPQPEDSLLTIHIQDEGVGIAADDLPHICARFYRGTPRRQDGAALDIPGTGQGLYLTQTVIDAHGGNLTITSEVGRGSNVTLQLPLTAEVTVDWPTHERSIWDFPTHAGQTLSVAADAQDDNVYGMNA